MSVGVFTGGSYRIMPTPPPLCTARLFSTRAFPSALAQDDLPVTLTGQPRSCSHFGAVVATVDERRRCPMPRVTLPPLYVCAVAERDGVLELTAVRARADRGHPGDAAGEPTVAVPGTGVAGRGRDEHAGSCREQERDGIGVDREAEGLSEPIE